MAQGKDMTTTVSIAGSIDPSLQKSIASAQKSVKGLGTSLKAIGGITLGVVVAGAIAAGAALGKGLENAIAFEKQMANVGTLLEGDVNKRLGELGKEVIDVSNRTGIATADLTDGLYQVVSAFGDTAESGKQLEIAAKLAKAGNSTTTESINLLSAVTKGYGDTSAGAIQKAADLAQETARLGQTTFPELAASMGKVIPLASTMGVKQEELFGAMATLTGVTGNAAEVSTQLRGTIQGFLQPTDMMQKAIKALGYQNGKTMLQSLGLKGAMDKLKKSVKNDELAFASLFGSVEAKNAVLALTGAQAQNFTEKSLAMTKASGSAERAFEAQINNFHDLWGMLKNMANNALTQLGNKLVPYLKTLAKKVLPYVKDALAKLDVYLDKVISSVAAYLEKVDFTPVIKGFKFLWKYREPIGLVVGALGGFAAILAVVTAAQWAFNIAMAANPIGLAVIAIATVIAGVVLLIYYWDEVKAAFLRVNDWLTEKLGSWKYLILGLCSPIGAVALYCIEHWDEVCAFFSSAWESIKAAWTSGCDVLSRLWDACFKLVVAVFREVLALFGVEWDEFLIYWQAAGEIIKNQWAAVCAFFTSENSRFVQVANAIRDGFISAFQGVKDFVMGVITYIKAQLESLISTITGFTAGIKGMGGSLRKAFQAVNPFGGSDRSLPAKAAGGFVTSPSLCGEAGTEAVISFDPRYRDANRGYLMTAAEMLGMSAAPARETRQNVVTYDVGGITFAPVIKAEGGDGGQDIMRQLRNCIPEFMDMIEEALQQRNGGRYA